MVEQERLNRQTMKSLMLKVTSEEEVDAIVEKYDGVVGRDARKWAKRLQIENEKFRADREIRK